MLIISGVKETKKRKGYAVDFCLYCREIRQVAVYRHQLIKHFYFIGYKSDSGPWHMRTCVDCDGIDFADIDTYSQLLKKPLPRIEEALKNSNPNIYRNYKERLALEIEVKRAPLGLDDEERMLLIKEPFKAQAHQIETVYSTATKFDKHLVLSLIICIGVSLGMLIYVGGMSSGPQADRLSTVGTLIALFSFLWIVFSWGTASKRRIKKHHLPPLLRSLRPLKPNEAELKNVENFYGITKAKIGKKWIFRVIRNGLEESVTIPVTTHSVLKEINVVKGDYVKAMRKKP